MKQGDFVYVEIPGQLKSIVRLSGDITKGGLFEKHVAIPFDYKFEVNFARTPENSIESIIIPSSNAAGISNAGATLYINERDLLIISKLNPESQMYKDMIEQTTKIKLG